MGDIRFIKVKPHSPEWYEFRLKNGVGASNIGTIRGENEWKSSLRLHNEYLGIEKQTKKNLRMCIGLIGEDIQSTLFEYWNEDEDVFLSNIENNKKERILYKVDAYCVNSEMPNVYASLDREYVDKENNKVLVELKNKTYSSYAQYENKMNVCEIFQLATQLLCSEYKYGYICYFIDNTRIEVFKMTYQEALSLKKIILEAVTTFWNNIIRARQLITQIHYAKSQYQMNVVAQKEMELLQCEPKLDNSLAYLEYMTEKAKQRKNSIGMKGNEELLKKSQTLKKLAEKRKKIITQETEIKAELARVMRENDKTQIDFGRLGSVDFFGGRFKVKIK
jgi:hypothetical protein